ncbi:MAG TPA: hypothetical protein VJ914_01670 [Pseudonocardiaceae bacterium]|nr:hypothetical protein [Pseudonocardiaceae bacterium]
MTPQRWKGAGILFLGIAALLVVAALVVVLLGNPSPVRLQFEQYVPISGSLQGFGTPFLRAVVLGAFAGVSFFLGLACFIWCGMAQARQQRADILIELAALRARTERSER